MASESIVPFSQSGPEDLVYFKRSMLNKVQRIRETIGVVDPSDTVKKIDELRNTLNVAAFGLPPDRYEQLFGSIYLIVNDLTQESLDRSSGVKRDYFDMREFDQESIGSLFPDGQEPWVVFRGNTVEVSWCDTKKPLRKKSWDTGPIGHALGLVLFVVSCIAFYSVFNLYGAVIVLGCWLLISERGGDAK